MKRIACALLLCFIATASPAAQPVAPALLQEQIGRLVALLRDSHAAGYPEATLVQYLDVGKSRRLAATVFTVEAFGGGNNHTQYFALFEHESGADAKHEHFQLIDVMPIGGKGWRAVMSLRIKLVREKAGRLRLVLPVLEVGPDDPPNFPSRKATVTLLLDTRLSEAAPR